MQLTRDTSVFALGAIAGKAIGVLLLPILTRSLAPDEYGRLEILSTLGSALISALLLGLDRAALRLSFTERDGARRSMLGTWYALATALALPPALVLAAGSGAVSEVLFGDRAHANAVGLVGWITLLGTYQVVALVILRAERRPGAYAALSGGALVLNGALVLVAFATARLDLDGVLLAYAVSLGASAVAGAVLVRQVTFGRPSRRAVTSLLALGLPLAPAAIVTWVAEFANRAIVLAAAGPTEVGFLGLGLRVASVAGLAVGGLQLAWEPHAYARASGPDALARLAADARRSLVFAAALVVVVAAVARDFLLLLAGPAYAPALPVVGFGCLAVLAAALFIVTATPSQLASAMRDVGAATVLGLALGVIATISLAPAYGGAGAAAGIAIGQLCAAIAVGWLGRTRAALPVAWGPTALVLVSAAAVTLAATAIDTPPAVRVVLVAVFGLVLLAEGSTRRAAGALLGRFRG